MLCILNGPPRAGKTTVIRLLGDRVAAGRLSVPGMVTDGAAASPASSSACRRQDFLAVRISDMLKVLTHEFFGLLGPDGHGLPADHFESVKDVRLGSFGGLTPRQAYIEHSETRLKPNYGEDYLGVQTLSRTLIRYGGSPPRIVAIDGGFTEELAPFIDSFDPARVLLCRIHRVGTDFSGDSRSYLDIPGIRCVDIDNPPNDPQAAAAGILREMQALESAATLTPRTNEPNETLVGAPDPC